MLHTKASARRRAVTMLVGALLLLNGAIAQAQSGRRIPKRPTSADPMPPKASEPPVAQPEEKKSDKPALTLLLAKHMNDFMYSSDIYLNIVMDGFLERVSKLKNVKVEPGGRDMNRKQAYDAAKAATDRYVVWFQLASDNMSSSPQSDYSYAYNLYIDYVVYTPGTGKTKSSGHVYQRTRSVGPVGMPVPGRTAVEYNLRYAGMEMADRVLGSLDLDSPTTTPPTH
jgi:hypothetical protein